MLTSDLLLQACENGRGAILLSVARGKVSEGIDFGGYSLTFFFEMFPSIAHTHPKSVSYITHTP